jgi:hypothetical protein
VEKQGSGPVAHDATVASDVVGCAIGEYEGSYVDLSSDLL